MDSFSCMPILRIMHLRLNMLYFLNVILKCLYIWSRNVQFGSCLPCWCRILGGKWGQNWRHTVKKTIWHHAQESSYTAWCKTTFAPVSHAEISDGYARKEILAFKWPTNRNIVLKGQNQNILPLTHPHDNHLLAQRELTHCIFPVTNIHLPRCRTNGKQCRPRSDYYNQTRLGPGSTLFAQTCQEHYGTYPEHLPCHKHSSSKMQNEWQTVKTLTKEQSDLGLYCLPRLVRIIMVLTHSISPVVNIHLPRMRMTYNEQPTVRKIYGQFYNYRY